MKIYKILLISLLVCNTMWGQEFGTYYYKGEPITLSQSDDMMLVTFADASDGRSLLNKIQTDVNFELYYPSPDKLGGKYYLLQKSVGAVIDKQEAVNNYLKEPYVVSASFLYTNEDGTLTGIMNEIVVKLKEENLVSDIERFANQYLYTAIEQNEFDPTIYHIFFSKNEPNDIFTLSNQFYQSGIVEFAEPNFFRYMNKHCSTIDPLFSNQWGLINTGQYGGIAGADINICDAWTYSKGSTVKVAVIDEGVDLTHPDLNVGTGFDATGGGSNGGPNSADAHGTNCAGIIGGENNTIGVSGVAPLVEIIPVRIAIGNGFGGWITSDAQIAAGINFASANADILSNSWGGGPPSAQIDAAILQAVTFGRNGLGCVVTFSTGNGNTAVAFPATNTNVLAVGAMSMCNERKNPSSCDGENNWGSNFGTGLSVVAPGVKIESTDIQGAGGYDPTDYFSSFNGTSSACPFVSGIAALMLDANPCLTWREVRDIIEQTANKVGSYSYNISKPNGNWNNEMGFGRVDASEAVAVAANLYKQNIYESNPSPIIYTSMHKIFSGENVTTMIANGKYTVGPAANITFYAGRAVHMEYGFTTEPGAVFLAEIQHYPCESAGDGGGEGKGGRPYSPVVIHNQGIPGKDISKISQITEIYPNPNNGVFTIEIHQKGSYVIQVKDLLGRTVYQDEINDIQKKTVHLDNSLPSGTYTICVNGVSNIHREKLVILR